MKTLLAILGALALLALTPVARAAAIRLDDVVLTGTIVTAAAQSGQNPTKEALTKQQLITALGFPGLPSTKLALFAEVDTPNYFSVSLGPKGGNGSYGNVVTYRQDVLTVFPSADGSQSTKFGDGSAIKGQFSGTVYVSQKTVTTQGLPKQVFTIIFAATGSTTGGSTNNAIIQGTIRGTYRSTIAP